MGIERLIPVAVTLAISAASTGQLPGIIHAVHVGQYRLIQDSKASKWPRATLLPANRAR
jgi:hypothetical protein